MSKKSYIFAGLPVAAVKRLFVRSFILFFFIVFKKKSRQLFYCANADAYVMLENRLLEIYAIRIATHHIRHFFGLHNLRFDIQLLLIRSSCFISLCTV